MSKPAFELFELICVQLKDAQQFVLTERAIPQTLAAEIKRAFRQPAFENALQSSINHLSAHFLAKGAQLPFTYDHNTGIVQPVDHAFIQFVTAMNGVRTVGKDSKAFERAVCTRLAE